MRKCQTCRFSQDRFQLFFGVESFLKRFKRKCSIGKVKKNGWMHLIDGNQTTGEVEGVKLIFGSRKRRSKHTTSSSTTFLKSWFFEGDYALRHESKYGLLHTISGGELLLERKRRSKVGKDSHLHQLRSFFWVPSVSATQFFTPTLEWYMNKS